MHGINGSFDYRILSLLSSGLLFWLIHCTNPTSVSAQLKPRDSTALTNLEVKALSGIRIRDICRLKGQEENTLQGLGIVVGLKGTGDENLKMMTSMLARLNQLMGGQIAVDARGNIQISELIKSKNAAVVLVTATIPAAGAQPGDKFDVRIHSEYNAKSLEGGNLMLTELWGPRADRRKVYALAQGPITIEDVRLPTSGRISNGCKMEATVQNEFLNANNVFTLVLDSSQSSFATAQYIEQQINDDRSNPSVPDAAGNSKQVARIDNQPVARAIDQLHIEVQIPVAERERPVQFVSDVLDISLPFLKSKKVVLIREREGVVIIGDDVMIAPVAISHKNLAVSTQSSPGRGSSFIGLNPEANVAPRSRLKDLVDSLNAISVPTDDIIAIIKGLKSQGNLFGELKIE